MKINTEEEFKDAAEEISACHWFANGTTDDKERLRANEKMIELERAMDDSPFDGFDEDGRVIKK